MFEKVRVCCTQSFILQVSQESWSGGSGGLCTNNTRCGVKQDELIRTGHLIATDLGVYHINRHMLAVPNSLSLKFL